MRLSCSLLLVVFAPLCGGLLLGFFRWALLCRAPGLAAYDFRRALARLRELQDRVLEELHEAEHRCGLRGVHRLGPYDQILLVVRAIELGEIFSARLIEHELDSKLGHREPPRRR